VPIVPLAGHNRPEVNVDRVMSLDN